MAKWNIITDSAIVIASFDAETVDWDDRGHVIGRDGAGLAVAFVTLGPRVVVRAG